MARSRNFLAELLVGTTPSPAGTDLAFAHSLGTPPRGFIICRRGAPTNFYNGSAAWTASTFTIRADTVGTPFLVLVFG